MPEINNSNPLGASNKNNENCIRSRLAPKLGGHLLIMLHFTRGGWAHGHKTGHWLGSYVCLATSMSSSEALYVDFVLIEVFGL